MRICIIGCGAIGSLFAAHLGRLKELEVFAYDVSTAHVEAINQNGLRLSGEVDFTVPVQASTDPGRIPKCDYVIIATKATRTRDAMEACRPVFGPQSAVCSVQNGLGHEEILAEYVPYVIRSATFQAATVLEPGHVEFLGSAGHTSWYAGPYEGTATPLSRVEELADWIQRSGMKCHVGSDVVGAQWMKLAFNASTNPVAALTRLHQAAVSGFQTTAKLVDDVINEVETVARKLGIKLLGDPREMVEAAARVPGKHQPSMLQDVLAGRATEIDFISGAVVKKGLEAGVSTPLNSCIWALLKGLEHSWSNP